MWRCVLWVAAAITSARLASAQRVPGRDLLDFPIGTIAEAPALATLARDGLWNPAASILDPEHRFRFSASALDASSQQGVTSRHVGLAASLGRYTVGLSALRATVADLTRTESDPQSVGSDIPYGATLVSASLASRFGGMIATGLALRYQHGELDDVRRSKLTLDAGAILTITRLSGLRVAASTFLLHPGVGTGSGGDSRFNFAADVRVLGSASGARLKAGYSLSYSRLLTMEQYGVLTGVAGPLELNGGLLRTTAHGTRSWRSRFGVGLRSPTLTVGLAREENTSGLAPLYQVVLGTHIRR